MERLMKVNGKMENKMEKECIIYKMAIKKLDFGKMVKELNGLIMSKGKISDQKIGTFMK